MKTKHIPGMLLGASILFLPACEKETNIPAETFAEKKISVQNRTLTTYCTGAGKDYLVVFEAGLGDAGTVWFEKNIPAEVAKMADVVVYDRAGYGKSGAADNPRDIARLREDLEKVTDALAGNRKIVLVGHSLGGMIIRDYAVKNSAKVAALLFVDPSHEYYNNPSQELEDFIYGSFKTLHGEKFGGTMEARQLVENSAHMATLGNLPNVPVTVLTSMKIAPPQNDATDRQRWYEAHEKLGAGVPDFKHVQTTQSGHYIQREQATLVLDELKALLGKLR